MKQLPKKYRDILATGKDLFWKHGFRRVTVEEICQESGVSKMTFYKYFPNKAELAKAILDKLFSESMNEFKKLMLSDIPFEKKMELQIKMKSEGTKDISEEFVKDIYGDPESELFDYWRGKAQESIQIVVELYRQAQSLGHIRQDIKIDFILYMINKTFELVNDDELISKYDTMQDLILEINRFFLYGILPYKSTGDD
ncbi:MAG: TetR/AcrR family transcriptional regulator [Bacteroidales bacterium]